MPLRGHNDSSNQALTDVASTATPIGKLMFCRIIKLEIPGGWLRPKAVIHAFLRLGLFQFDEQSSKQRLPGNNETLLNQFTIQHLQRRPNVFRGSGISV